MHCKTTSSWAEIHQQSDVPINMQYWCGVFFLARQTFWESFFKPRLFDKNHPKKDKMKPTPEGQPSPWDKGRFSSGVWSICSSQTILWGREVWGIGELPTVTWGLWWSAGMFGCIVLQGLWSTRWCKHIICFSNVMQHERLVFYTRQDWRL